jgi:hypothetical protein
MLNDDKHGQGREDLQIAKFLGSFGKRRNT